jgi:hypothetical protein
MENKQTAVEWLANQIAEMPNTYLTGKYGLIELSGVVDDKIYRINADIMYLIDEAKQMEKEHIMMAYIEGRINQGLKQSKSSEQYYNETYGK